jgi:hypothetical protein
MKGARRGTGEAHRLLLTTDAVVSEIKEDKPEPAGAGAGGGMYWSPD